MNSKDTSECKYLLPPGIDGHYREVVSGGTDNWLPFNVKKVYTNAFIVQADKVRRAAGSEPSTALNSCPPIFVFEQLLLGYKKRGFGAHK